MEFIIYDQSFNPTGIVEVFESAIWTERFRTLGDFELQVPIISSVVTQMAQDNYLALKDTDRAMIIESVDITTDEDTGKKLLICKGSSLETILQRRVVWTKTVLSGNPLNQLYKILNENIMNPDDPNRRISNFIFPLPIAGDPVYDYLHGKTLKCQFTGDTLYDVVVSVCKTYDLDFKITLTPDKKFKFELILPIDHTDYQTENEVIIFSPEFDTLVSSEWYQNSQMYKNVALVLGQGEGSERVRRVVFSDDAEPSGLDRREMYVDARDVTTYLENGEEMDPEDYEKSLDYRGYQKLAENTYASAFDGKVETSIGPQYGTNYKIGDYVTVVNEFGLGSVAQITEYIRSFDADGYSAYPTFEMVV